MHSVLSGERFRVPLGVWNVVSADFGSILETHDPFRVSLTVTRQSGTQCRDDRWLFEKTNFQVLRLLVYTLSVEW